MVDDCNCTRRVQKAISCIGLTIFTEFLCRLSSTRGVIRHHRVLTRSNAKYILQALINTMKRNGPETGVNTANEL
ncbi:hypothetical protein RSAG8_10567, partial [Rhizoctonia solani AG-8 WAC10335]